ncbi:hypothetical protein GCM10010428_78240 [Actinosynnema pretiosum subsp. pretiosum]
MSDGRESGSGRAAGHCGLPACARRPGAVVTGGQAAAGTTTRGDRPDARSVGATNDPLTAANPNP